MAEDESIESNEYEAEFNELIRFSSIGDAENGLTHLLELPREYRLEIDAGYTTGWDCLDKYLQGVRLGEVTVITADTGVGKTTFCTHLMVNCAMQGLPVWLNSWEMKTAVLQRKVASIVLRRSMKMRAFTSFENEQFDEWALRHKMYINQNNDGIRINQFTRNLMKARELGVQVVMLDHLDHLVLEKEKRHEAIEETVRRLHDLALYFNMHFFLICHPKQANSGEEIGMHGLKGSSAIKQYADNIIILHRCARKNAQDDPNKVKVQVAKNRMFGVEGFTYLFYVPAWDGYEQL
jgi:twinkle protein